MFHVFLSITQGGEPMVLEKWETAKHGLFKKDIQHHWEQYVFRLEDSAYLRYYSDMKKVNNIKVCLQLKPSHL